VVFPNQICTISQAIDLIVHLSEARVQRVKSSPEKHMEAMPIKNTNSAVIARRARTTTLFETMKNASLGKRMQAPQARMSKPKSDAEVSPDERPFSRRIRYRAVITIKEVSKIFHMLAM
jgi:hypothetical protein